MLKFAAICTLSLLVLGGCKKEESPVPLGVSTGNKTPELSGEDVNGKLIKLSQYQGKVVLIDFWATWCPPCVAEIPREVELVRQFQGRPFVVLGVSRDESKQKLKEFLAREQLPWANIQDASGNIADQWGINGLPTFILIDSFGVIRNRWVGGGQFHEIRNAIEQAVREAERKK